MEKFELIKNGNGNCEAVMRGMSITFEKEEQLSFEEMEAICEVLQTTMNEF